MKGKNTMQQLNLNKDEIELITIALDVLSSEISLDEGNYYTKKQGKILTKLTNKWINLINKK
tara:strand:- start:58 stop:243 length:186 start_codon:yes stop_codon:yes gene_type:complete